MIQDGCQIWVSSDLIACGRRMLLVWSESHRALFCSALAVIHFILRSVAATKSVRIAKGQGEEQ